jgi:hypothetical protein
MIEDWCLLETIRASIQSPSQREARTAELQ